MRYCAFTVNLGRCVGRCNTLNDLSNRVYVRNKKKKLILSLFNMITRVNQSKILTNHILCKCKPKFDGRIHINLNQKWNIDKCLVSVKIKKNTICAKEKIYLVPCSCSCKYGKYLGSIIDD